MSYRPIPNRSDAVAVCKHLYVDEKMSFAQVRARTGYGYGTIRNLLTEAGVVTRRQGKRFDGLRYEAARDLVLAGWDPERVAEVLKIDEETVLWAAKNILEAEDGEKSGGGNGKGSAGTAA